MAAAEHGSREGFISDSELLTWCETERPDLLDANPARVVGEYLEKLGLGWPGSGREVVLRRDHGWPGWQIVSASSTKGLDKPMAIG